MSQYIFKSVFTVLCVFCMVSSAGICAASSKAIYKAKKDLFQLKIEHKAIDTLKFLVDEYEQYASPLFLQEYVQEFGIVLKELKNEDLGKEYEQMVLVLLMENYRLNVSALQYKFAQAVSYINQAIVYWSAQQDNPIMYTFHKNPAKWFSEETFSHEIQRHINILENALQDYTVKLGRLVNHSSALLLLRAHELSYAHMSTLCQELYAICGDVIIEVDEKENVAWDSFFRAVYVLSIEQKNIVKNLLRPVKAHSIPTHFERYWLQYAAGLGLCVFLLKQKNNPASSINRLIKKYNLVKHEKNFIKSCKKNFVLPFQQLGNILFGFPLDLSDSYPEKFEPLVQSYNKAHADSIELANRGHDKMPSNFDTQLVTHIPWIGLFKWNIPQATIKEQEFFLKSNVNLSYFLYMVLRGKADILLSFLNMSHEIDLILKIIAAMPAVALVYSGYKGVQRVGKFGPYANYKPLYNALVDLEQCVLEASLEKEAIDHNKSDYFQGKLFFLKYCAKKCAAPLFSQSTYKSFARDIQKITLSKNHADDHAKIIEVIMKKYGIERLAY